VSKIISLWKHLVCDRFLYCLMKFFPCTVCVVLNSSVTVNDKLKRLWNAVVVPWSKVLSPLFI
jgi:hypothetical protein